MSHFISIKLLLFSKVRAHPGSQATLLQTNFPLPPPSKFYCLFILFFVAIFFSRLSIVMDNIFVYINLNCNG